MTTAERSSSGENSSRPIALTPSRHARPSAACRANAASRPSSRSRPSATSSAATSVTAGVNGVDPVSSAASRSRPVEVVARRVARASAPSAAIETIASESPAASSAPSASRRRRRRGPTRPSRAARRRGSRRRRRRRGAGFPATRASDCDVRDDAGRRLGVARARRPPPPSRRGGRADLVGSRRLAPGVAELVDVRAVGGCERDQRSPNAPARDDERPARPARGGSRPPTRTRRIPTP